MSIAIVDAAFSTLDQARAYLNLAEDDTDNDDLIRECINRAAQMIQDYTGRTLKKTTYANKHLDGTGETTLYLPEYPITAMTSLKKSSTREFASESELTIYNFSGSQSASAVQVIGDPDTGELTLVNGDVWPEGPATVKISYTAGYNVTSNEGNQFVQAELAIVNDLYFAIGKDPSLASSAMGGVAETYQSRDVAKDRGIPERAITILYPHRRPACVA